jgi:hypothetical protein
VAPASDAPLDHLLFALKHEGLQLQAAVLALKKIDRNDLGQAFAKSPSSAYLRQICFLWELANGDVLADLPTASYVMKVPICTALILSTKRSMTRWTSTTMTWFCLCAHACKMMANSQSIARNN